MNFEIDFKLFGDLIKHNTNGVYEIGILISKCWDIHVILQCQIFISFTILLLQNFHIRLAMINLCRKIYGIYKTDSSISIKFSPKVIG
jgi:hypothetical protein